MSSFHSCDTRLFQIFKKRFQLKKNKPKITQTSGTASFRLVLDQTSEDLSIVL